MQVTVLAPELLFKDDSFFHVPDDFIAKVRSILYLGPVACIWRRRCKLAIAFTVRLYEMTTGTLPRLESYDWFEIIMNTSVELFKGEMSGGTQRLRRG